MFFYEHKFAAIFAALGAILALGASFLFFRKYESRVEMLVIQKQNSWKVDDAYSAAKSAESISSMLVHIMETTSFLDRVMQAGSGFSLDQEILDYDLESRKKIWEKMIDVRMVKNSGIIKFKIYHKDRNQAEQFAGAAANVLIQKASQYHGGGDRVEVKPIDGPITPSYPLGLPIAANSLLGAAIGVLIGVFIDKKSFLGRDEFNFASGELKLLKEDFPAAAKNSFQSAPVENDVSNEKILPPANLPF